MLLDDAALDEPYTRRREEFREKWRAELRSPGEMRMPCILRCGGGRCSCSAAVTSLGGGETPILLCGNLLDSWATTHGGVHGELVKRIAAMQAWRRRRGECNSERGVVVTRSGGWGSVGTNTLAYAQHGDVGRMFELDASVRRSRSEAEVDAFIAERAELQLGVAECVDELLERAVAHGLDGERLQELHEHTKPAAAGSYLHGEHGHTHMLTFGANGMVAASHVDPADGGPTLIGGADTDAQIFGLGGFSLGVAALEAACAKVVDGDGHVVVDDVAALVGYPGTEIIEHAANGEVTLEARELVRRVLDIKGVAVELDAAHVLLINARVYYHGYGETRPTPSCPDGATTWGSSSKNNAAAAGPGSERAQRLEVYQAGRARAMGAH